MLDDLVGGGQCGWFLEYHRLVQRIDRGDLLSGLNPAQQGDRLVPITGGTDPQRGMQSRCELRIGGEALQPECFDRGHGEPLVRRSRQRAQIERLIARGSDLDEVLDRARR
ncbi:hypothetical protein [Nocardia cyriacigeorgica]|uniref:hypothetical protein n=1 Tax=Nocardia cyriacigeorgica TaxID=135487 RepID=UPI0021578947|nr:hypothetical protein [Nocardia cyriacigeorgica]